MIFFQPLYNYLLKNYGYRINHFALIKLSLFGLDKTCLYFLIFAVARLIWLLLAKKRQSPKREAKLWLFVFYLLLLLMLTVFRDSYFPWQLEFHWGRPFSQINLYFMHETVKLIHGASLVDFFYNSFGNVAWFFPFGWLFPQLFVKRKPGSLILLSGLGLSIIIESLQFLLMTGVSDIDDVFFNFCGCCLGYLLFCWRTGQRTH
ncbi:MAG: VanZ family protein [Lactobacillus sp.]|jgi:glycopeptide antibiotics resistance protein|nr:VanZ family protein [Lactobacillus sp.]